MNLIDFHVTQVLAKPTKHTTEEGKDYWLTPVVYWDDGEDDLHTEVMSFTEEHANSIKPGFVGQH